MSEWQKIEILINH